MTTSDPYMTSFPDQRPPAGGLHVTGTRRTYLFEELFKEREEQRTRAIGSGSRCAVHVRGEQVQPVHAYLERRRGVMYLVDHSPDHSVFADGWHVVRPVPLLVGMVLQLGDAQLVATDHTGRFGINAGSVSDLCRKALERWGSLRTAGRGLRRSHTFVRNHCKPRSEPSKK